MTPKNQRSAVASPARGAGGCAPKFERDSARASVRACDKAAVQQLSSAPIERISYKVSQAAEATGVSRYVLYSAIRNEELQAFQPNPGGDFLVLRDDLREWITRYRANPRGTTRAPIEAEESSKS